MKTDAVLVVGGGGHAKVVIAALEAAGVTVAAVLDDDPAKWGTALLGFPIRGGISELTAAACPAVLAIGNNAVRKKISEEYPHVEWLSVVHPQAWVHDSVRIGQGTVICAGAVLQPGTILGEHVIVNTGATIDHDCVVEDYVHLAPGVHLSGGVCLGEGAMMGVASAAIPNSRIGSWSTVGAGGVVINAIPDRATAVGIPAVPLRTYRPS